MLKNFLTFFAFVITIVYADDPYIPCQSYISFSYDDSSSLSTNGFKAQMNFIKNAIGALNYPARLRAEGGFGGEFTWNSKFTISQMQSLISSAEQTSIPYSLLQQFSSLATSYELLNDYGSRFGAIIFISDTSDTALRNADRLFSKLKGISLTFVLLGPNVDSTKLRNFTTNFLYWQDLSQPKPDNWDLLSYHAYGCDTPYNPSTSMPVVTQSTTIPYMPYYPCQTMITVLADISKTLNVNQFHMQRTFIKTILSQINHPERIRYGAYNEENGNMTYKWNDTNTQEGLQQAIDKTIQSNYPPSLAGAMRALSNNAPQNRTIPDSTIIFVTDTTNSIQIQSALNLYNSLLKGRVRITFILTGNKADASKLQGFDAIFYNWQHMSTAQPMNWDFSAALRCTPQTTVTGIPSTQSTPSGSYIPCQSWIHFGADDSNTLNPNGYATQLSFISTAIGAINHPERIQVFGVYAETVSWNSGLSIPQIQSAVMTIPQEGTYRLRLEFDDLLTGLQNVQVNNTPVGALIFISDTSDEALLNANNSFAQIPSSVRITFVLLGPNADQNKLTQFSNNFISWRDLSQPQPDSWNNLYGPAYGCIGSVSTVRLR